MNKLPRGMDKECVKICEAINLFGDNFFTIESCCGHGKTKFQVFMRVTNLKALPRILYYIDSCHSGFSDWRMIVYTDCGMSYPTFLLEGPIGAYKEANEIARMITEEFNEPNLD